MRLAQTVNEVMLKFSDRPAIGERPRIFVNDPVTSRVVLDYASTYSTITYKQLWARACTIAAELQQNDIHPLRQGEKMAFLAFTSGDYAALDLACIRLGVTTIPLQSTASVPELAGILEETEPAVLAVSPQYLAVATELVRGSASLRRIVLFDFHQEVDDHRDAYNAAKDALKDRGDVEVTPLADIIARGQTLPEAAWPVEDSELLAMLIYTSGSTGSPKGAMYIEALAAGMWGGSWSQIFSDARPISIHYMPMSHVAGHSSLKNTLARGGTCYFTARSNLSSLLEDIALAKPTELSLVPRVCEMLYQRFHGELAKRFLKGGDESTFESEILSRMRHDVLGGQVSWASCSSAPLSAELRNFIERLLGIELHNVYGSTEAGGIWVDNTLLRPPVTDYKIIDAPELGYYTSDTPFPRGELLLKTTSIIPGYYKRPELSAELFDAEGFYRTGDIVAEVAPDQLHFVDRRKNVIKLSQGEFVATAKLETLFAASPLVRHIYIYARSEWSSLLAVVVPAAHVVEQFAAMESELKRLISDSFREIAKKEQLKPYEIPRDFIIEHEPFSQANGLLSDHGKAVWPKLRTRYAPRLDALYTDYASKEADRLRSIYQSSGSQTVLETVQQAVASIVGSSGIEVKPSDRFRDLGGDSLSAVQLSTLLEEAFDMRVPIDMVISQATDLQGLADYIEQNRNNQVDRPTVSSVHGVGAAAYHASQLTLDKFVSPAVLEQAFAAQSSEAKPRTILLTGASGYLGRFLSLSLLSSLAQSGGKLICIVRGKDDAAALQRLADSFESPDPRLSQKFAAISAGHLEVLAGDIGRPQLGLDNTTWGRLAKEVDAIVHAGAHVNHLLPYSQLFDANVLGTTELIELALTDRRKRFAFISSIAVAAPSGERDAIDEASDIRLALPSVAVERNYANGYATSKWAGEVLLREASEKYGLPVTVFRSSMILAHRDFAGQLNVPDAFTRLLISILLTGTAPRSFYKTGGETHPANAHYDGLPVDFTADVIAALGLEHGEGYHTYNLVNPHEDGISLDTFVDWMQDLGYRIRRVDDYQAWLSEFSQSLKALPEDQRARSSLALLHGFEEPADPVSGSLIPSTTFREAAARLRFRIGDLPHVSRALIKKYVADLELLNLVPPPEPSIRRSRHQRGLSFDVV